MNNFQANLLFGLIDCTYSYFTVKEPEIVPKLPIGPSLPERKPLDSQVKIITPKGKPKKLTEGSSSKNLLDSRKKIVVTKIKGARPVDDDHDDEMEMLDVEDLDDEDEDKVNLATHSFLLIIVL